MIVITRNLDKELFTLRHTFISHFSQYYSWAVIRACCLLADHLNKSFLLSAVAILPGFRAAQTTLSVWLGCLLTTICCTKSTIIIHLLLHLEEAPVCSYLLLGGDGANYLGCNSEGGMTWTELSSEDL